MTERPVHGETFPRRMLIAAAALIVFSLLLTVLAQATGAGRTEMARAAVVEQRSLTFDDAPDGGIVVADPALGIEVVRVAPGAHGFLRSVVRSLARERLRRGVGPETPFTLTRYADGRLELGDPTTGRTIALEAFGVTNAGAFARLMRTADDARVALAEPVASGAVQ